MHFYLATILPDLAGHHLKQPYGKEYSIFECSLNKEKILSFFKGVLIEQTIKDLPKHLQNLKENAAVVAENLVDRFWAGLAEINRRVAEIRTKSDASTTKQTASKSN